MSYGFTSNAYGCFRDEMIPILNQYLTPEALSGKKCIDLTLGDVDDAVTILRNMRDIQVEYEKDEETQEVKTIRLSAQYTVVDFDKTPNGIYITVIVRNRENIFKNPKVFVPTIVMFNN